MSVQPAPEAAANAPSATVANTTLWTLNLHVIPNLPLCFSNLRQVRQQVCVGPVVFDHSSVVNNR